MEILASLDQRLPPADGLQRVVIVGPETGARHVSAVLVRVPPGHEFPLHTHPVSEDCFFVLSGAGAAIEPSRRAPIAAPAGVWIPAGHPHGLAAGPTGMLEVGFQSPADPTAVPFDPHGKPPADRALITVSLSSPGSSGPGRWTPVFPARPHWRYLDPHYVAIRSGQRLVTKTGESEVVIVVVRGAVRLEDGTGGRIDGGSALCLGADEAIELRAESPGLLVAVRARAAR